jgi:hypothetical protein
MNTLNKIAENIAFKLGDQFNMTLRESIKNTVLDYRAKFIRDDTDRNFISDVHLSQVLNIEFEVVDLLTEFKANFELVNAICPDTEIQQRYKVLRSKTLVPLPVRTKLSRRSPYQYLGRITGEKGFTYTDLEQYYYIRTTRYNTKTVYYTFINGRIYIINNLKECDINNTLEIVNVMVKSIFEDPREAYNACSDRSIKIDDRMFPIPMDMLMQISNSIIRGEYRLPPTDGETINIKPDMTDGN